jgi:hypothetical protein
MIMMFSYRLIVGDTVLGTVNTASALMLMSYGVVGMVGAAFRRKERLPYRLLYVVFATGCAMVIFGVNRMWPGMLPETMQVLTLLLFAVARTSLGVSIFTMTVTRIKAAMAARPAAAA